MPALTNRQRVALLDAKYNSHFREKRNGRNRQWSLQQQRVNEINRIIAFRHGGLLSVLRDGTYAGDEVTIIRLVAHHCRDLPNPQGRFETWSQDHAPCLSKADVRAHFEKAINHPRKFKAVKIGWMLKLSKLHRQALDIRTIDAYDWEPGEKAALKSQRKAEAETRRRRRNGAIPRTEYEAKSLSTQKPWEADGISRSTYYRRKRKAEVVDLAQVRGSLNTPTEYMDTLMAHGPVSPPAFGVGGKLANEFFDYGEFAAPVAVTRQRKASVLVTNFGFSSGRVPKGQHERVGLKSIMQDEKTKLKNEKCHLPWICTKRHTWRKAL